MQTQNQTYLSVIVPVYNAAGFLEGSLKRIDAYLSKFELSCELILIDDGSPDGSSAILKAFCGKERGYSAVHIQNTKNMGKGYSVARAMLQARGKYRIFTDCDLAYPPEEVGKILRSLEKGFDVAVACRVDKDSRYTISPAFFRYLYTRHLASRVLNLILRTFLLPLCRDSQAGLKGFTGQAAQEIFSRQRIHGFSFDMEVLFLADRLNYLVEEVAVDYSYFDEPTTIKFAEDTFKVIIDIFRIKYNGILGKYRLPAEISGRKELMVVADDFGFSEGISRGILSAYDNGIVRSFSVMTNSPAFESSIAMIKDQSRYDMGIHFTLTAGRPVCNPIEVSSLVDKNGEFHPIGKFYRRLLTGRIKYNDVYRELTAQFLRLKEKVGKISHINGHHHVHALPVVCEAAAKIARSNNIRYVRAPNSGYGGSTFKTFLKKWLLGRFKGSYPQFWHRKGIHTAQNFAGFEFAGDDGLLKRWEHFIKHMPYGSTEVMAHPGIIDEDINDTYLKGREIELKVLMDPSLKDLIKKENITLTGIENHCLL